MNSLSRVKILQLTVVGVVLVLLVRLFYLQVVDDSYKTRADNNALRYMVQFLSLIHISEPTRPY